ncbi:hypothetical protein [Phenylobacterium sp.]|uniref:hypothetical protein n=1 Tax=Phenylobacterium sp. TaxID=1871053 RepID=UPI002F95F99B
MRALTSDGAFADVELDVDSAGDALTVALSVQSPRGHLLVVDGRFVAGFTAAWVELVRGEDPAADGGGGWDEDDGEDCDLSDGAG